jgi:hypothetical protein
MVARNTGSNQWYEDYNVENQPKSRKLDRIQNELINLSLNQIRSNNISDDQKPIIDNINNKIISSFKQLNSTSPDNAIELSRKSFYYKLVREISYLVIGQEVYRSTSPFGHSDAVFKPTELKIVKFNNSDEDIIRISFLFEVHSLKNANSRLLTATYPFQVLPLANSNSDYCVDLKPSNHQIWHETNDTSSKMHIALDFKASRIAKLKDKFNSFDFDNVLYEDKTSVAQLNQKIRMFLKAHPEELSYKDNKREANLFNPVNRGMFISKAYVYDTLEDLKTKFNDWISPYSNTGNQLFFDLVASAFHAAGIKDPHKLIAVNKDMEFDEVINKLQTTNSDLIKVHQSAPALFWRIIGSSGKANIIEAPFKVSINTGYAINKSVTTRLFYQTSDCFAQYCVESNVSNTYFNTLVKLITNDSIRGKLLLSNDLAGAKLRDCLSSYLAPVLINKNRDGRAEMKIDSDLLSVSNQSKVAQDLQGNLSVILNFKYSNFQDCLIKMTLDKFTNEIRIANLSINN